MAKDFELLEHAADCRGLAKKARRLGETFVAGPDRTQLLGYADELDAKAAALESRAAALAAAK